MDASTIVTGAALGFCGVLVIDTILHVLTLRLERRIKEQTEQLVTMALERWPSGTQVNSSCPKCKVKLYWTLPATEHKEATATAFLGDDPEGSPN